jgi:hypothetical protein
VSDTSRCRPAVVLLGALIGAAGGVVGALLVSGQWAPLASRRPDIDITDPAPHAVVGLELVVAGTSQRLPANHTVWVLVYSVASGRYYPQNGSALVLPDGDWGARVFVGVQQDAGAEFDLVAVLADAGAQQAFGDYHRRSTAAGAWDGLTPEELPPGAVQHDRVPVRRA